MRARSYRWLLARIFGLYNRPPAGYLLADIPGDAQGAQHYVPFWGTRLQRDLFAEEG